MFQHKGHIGQNTRILFRIPCRDNLLLGFLNKETDLLSFASGCNKKSLLGRIKTTIRRLSPSVKTPTHQFICFRFAIYQISLPGSLSKII
jgi:hypothetical protein